MARAIILILLGLLVMSVAVVRPSIPLGILAVLMVILGVSLTRFAQKVELKIWVLEHENRRITSQRQDGGK